jgi:microcystin degradation protein MlrC
MKNIAIGGCLHESNTFNPIITSQADFLVYSGAEIYDNSEAYLQARGIIEFFKDKPDCRLLPLVFARAVPNGVVDKTLYLRLKEKFFQLLDEMPQPDIFVLALHGSMRVQELGSAETDLLAEIKFRYPSIPIISGLDMHATITDKMLQFTTAMVGYKTAPHLDALETGYHAAQMAYQIISEGHALCMGAVKIPCLIAGEKSETDYPPMRGLIAELHKLEEHDEICAASYLLGFPWADAEENGVTALVVTKGDQQLADSSARYLAQKFLAVRQNFGFSSPAFAPQDALRLALQETCKPVFVSDSGDNPTAGSTADNTTLISLLSGELAELARTRNILVAGIYDPVAVEAGKDRLNQVISLDVGGRFDTKYCRPLTLVGKPLKLVADFGLHKASLLLFRTDEFDLIITSKHIGFTGIQMFEALEIDYLNIDLIVVKLGYLTEDFKAIAAKSYLALSQGCTDEVLSRLAYSRAYDLV